MLRPSLALAALALAVSSAHATDLPDAPEIGHIADDSGWYARVDAAHSLAIDMGRADVTGPLGDLGGGYFDAGDGLGAGIGIGYRFNDILRADVTARYGSYDVTGISDVWSLCGTGCRLDAAGRMETVDLDLNLYADLGTIMGVTPYVGAGIGGGYVSYDAAAASVCDAAGCAPLADVDGADDWRLTYSLMAGAAYAVSDSVSVDLGYRYTHVDDGDFATVGMGPSGDAVTIAEDGANRHLVMVGLRFKLQ